MIKRKYPKAAAQMRLRAQRYNECVDLAKEYEARGKVLIISPDDTCGVDTLKRDKQCMDRLYLKGYDDAQEIFKFL